MFSQLLAVAPLAGLVVASARPPPQTQFEADVRAIIDPVIDWNDQLFGLTAEDGTVPDKWHDKNGKPNATKAAVEEFVDQGVSLWKTAGPKFAAILKTADTTTANYDYLQFLEALFPASFDTTWFFRLAADWNSQLGFSEDDAAALGGKYDAAWLSAVLDAETVHPNVTRDYEVTTDMFWLPSELENYYYPKLAEHVEAVPWELVVEYCDRTGYNNKCNNGLSTYVTETCYSTSDIGATVGYIGVGNSRRGFNAVCQIYTDDKCTDAVSIPAQPCTLPPPFDVYCQPTSDWNGKFGKGQPANSASNPSGLTTVNAGSFKCTSA
ncbi:hypothetical protein BKA62DRAFT_127286 [Auriculariales sp. MPI-PUGE-AT-0066]|nr:hypothetical protein BKA62DRAFT_127286 [Auriculariales sp. MPI-PUGE-AT-0066]